jgi:hypothetical protein
MDERQSVGSAQDETDEDVEGHDARDVRETPVRVQRPILYLEESDELEDSSL